MISPLAKIRIIDDDPAMLESWKFLLNSLGCDVVTYNSAKEFLEKDDPHPMGCILLDVRMPEMSGLELQELLKETKNELPIVFCSRHGTIDMAVLAVRKGAVDFLEKPVEVERLVESLERACEKDAQRVEAQTLSLREKEKVDSLTQREKEVAKALADGSSNRAAGLKLGISEKTVQIHRGSLCKKLGIRSQVEISKVVEKYQL